LKYDVVIVGSGPAGIFSALEISGNSNLETIMLDRGPDLDKRKCPASRGFGCIKCEPCVLLQGWGGAGAFSDGKLTLSTEVGGWLSSYISKEELAKLIDYVDEIYLKYGAPKEVYGSDQDKIEEIERRAAFAGLHLVHQKLRHMGTERCYETLKNIRKDLDKRVEIRTRVDVKDILVEDGKVIGVRTSSGEKILGKYVILAPGRSGAEWLNLESQALGIKTLNNPVDVGIRIEVKAPIMEELTEALYEPKFIYYSKAFDDQVRTFCVNPYGEIITEAYNNIITVNGQSYSDRKTENTNFALLVSTSFTEPFKEPIAYGKYLARLTNLLSGGIIIQRLGDLEAGRRSTKERIERSSVTPTLKTATPGDLSFALPYRYITDIKEMIKALDQIAPGIASKDTLLYGTEVKFYSSRLKVSNELETKIRNLFAIGDGAGITRGLIQASVSGVIAARAILKRESQGD